MITKIIAGKETNCYPLTVAQDVLYRTFVLYANINELNLGVGCYYQMETNWDYLKSAIKKSCNWLECMNVRFTLEDNICYQYINPEAWDEEIPLLNLEDKTEDEVEDYLTKMTSKPVSFDNVNMSQFYLVQLSDGYSGFYMNVNHLLMDSCSIIDFIEKVYTIYFAKCMNQPYEKTVKGDYIKMIEKELQYPSSKAFIRDKEYWHKVNTAKAPLFAHFSPRPRLEEIRKESGNPEQRFGHMRDGNAVSAMKHYVLDAQTSNAYMKYCKSKNINMSSLVTLGLRTALSNFNHRQDDISIEFICNRRGTILEKYSGGNRMVFHPWRTIVPEDMLVTDALKLMTDSQSLLYRHAGYDELAITNERQEYHHMTDPDESFECLTFTYQPMVSELSKESALPPCKTAWYGNGTCSHNMYLTIQHRLTDGALIFQYEYRKEFTKEEELEGLFQGVNNAMNAISKHYDGNIGDVLNELER